MLVFMREALLNSDNNIAMKRLFKVLASFLFQSAAFRANQLNPTQVNPPPNPSQPKPTSTTQSNLSHHQASQEPQPTQSPTPINLTLSRRNCIHHPPPPPPSQPYLSSRPLKTPSAS